MVAPLSHDDGRAIADALDRNLTTVNTTEVKYYANIVDGLFAIADALGRIGTALEHANAREKSDERN